MRESYEKGLASHLGPEPYAAGGDAGGVALGKGTRRPAIELRKEALVSRADPLVFVEGNTADRRYGRVVCRRDGVGEPGMRENSRRENREIPQVSPSANDGDRPEKASGRTSGMHAGGKSDVPIVPTKRANNADEQSAAESVEGRGTTKGNAEQPTMLRTQSRTGMTDGLRRIREAARRDSRMRFTALLHHVTHELLWHSFHALKRQAAAGIDDVTWSEYAEDVWERLHDLHGRIHRGSYRPFPSLRAWAEKPDGRKRPLGIAALEDKIVQQAIRTVLEQIYEVDFQGFSYGFRPGRSCHDALDALSVAITRKKVSYVLDADIRGFFDAISHGWLETFLQHRIGDRRVLRLIRKWLRAGVIEDGRWSATEVGTAQGSVISPLLANVSQTCITFSTCGCGNGESGMLEATSSSYGMLTTSSWVSSTDTRRSGFCGSSVSGSLSSAWNCIPRKRGWLSLAVSRPSVASGVGSADLRLSILGASRTFVVRPTRPAAFRSSVGVSPNGCVQNS